MGKLITWAIALVLVVGSPAASWAGPGLAVADDGVIPAGTVLRVGDQFGLLEALMGLSGAGEGAPYEIDFTTMVPGVAQLHALQSGDLDAGSLSALALIQGGAGGLDVRAVARWRTDFALSALVSAPGVAGLSGWSDLRDRRVAFQRGTTAEAVVMLSLADAGLTLGDIEIVDVPQLQLGAVLQQGHADAGVLSEPLAADYLTQNPSADYVVGVDSPVGQSSLIAASTATLEDPAKDAALADFVARLDAAFRTLTADSNEFADLVVAVWGLERDHVETVLAGSSGVEMGDVPGDLAEPMDRLIEMLAANGDVPAEIEAVDLFDTRYNAALTSPHP